LVPTLPRTNVKLTTCIPGFWNLLEWVPSEMTEQQTAPPASTVRSLFDAFRERRRADAEALISADFTFTSPYDNAISRAVYFERCWPDGDHFKDFRIERLAVDPDGAFVTYWCTTDDGNSFRNTEYLRVKGSQVISVDVYFGANYRDGKFVPQPVTA